MLCASAPWCNPQFRSPKSTSHYSKVISNTASNNIHNTSNSISTSKTSRNESKKCNKKAAGSSSLDPCTASMLETIQKPQKNAIQSLGQGLGSSDPKQNSSQNTWESKSKPELMLGGDTVDLDKAI